MDGREGMTLQGSASYYLNRAGFGGSGGSGPGPNVHGAGGGSATAQAGGINTPPVFKTHSNPNIQVHSNVGISGGSVIGSAFQVENPSSNFAHGMSDRMNMSIVSSSPRGGETVKKKRGRPRKYGPDGANMSLGLSPMSASTPFAGTVTPGEKPRRGRPPGTGWKQKLAPLGDWMNSSAGLAFTPHVLHIQAGEDVAAKILAFAQQRPRALCILSGNGSVSAVTLRQSTTSGGTVTYEDTSWKITFRPEESNILKDIFRKDFANGKSNEYAMRLGDGRFEILCLAGSYLLAESGGPRNRTGGISISVCSPDGHMIGGAIGGKLIAANPVQVVACSFVYGGTKAKNKAESGSTDEKYLLEQQSAENSSTPLSAAPTQNLTPNSGTSVWPLGSRLDVKSSQGGIDLMRG